MHGKRHLIRRACQIILALGALVLLGPTVSRAQVSSNQPVVTTTNTVVDASKKHSVPEPSANILLLLGLGMTSLVGYGWKRKRGE